MLPLLVAHSIVLVIGLLPPYFLATQSAGMVLKQERMPQLALQKSVNETT